jgi:hypothetical protein
MLASAGCGDDNGGGGATGGGDGALQVVETDPVDMAVDVSPDTMVSAMFSDPLQEATVTTASFTVRRNDGPEVGGTVAVTSEGDTAVFMPNSPLALLATYTASLTTEIESLTGSTLDADYAWVFSTRDGNWGMAELIETDDTGDARNARLAIDPNGNALAVWQQSDGVRYNIWSNRYTPSGGWGMAERIEGDNAGDAGGPEVALDASGNALAVWPNRTACASTSGRTAIRRAAAGSRPS